MVVDFLKIDSITHQIFSIVIINLFIGVSRKMNIRFRTQKGKCKTCLIYIFNIDALAN